MRHRVLHCVIETQSGDQEAMVALKECRKLEGIPTDPNQLIADGKVAIWEQQELAKARDATDAAVIKKYQYPLHTITRS